MRFLKTLFSRSAHTNRRSLNKRTKTLSLESLEQRIALDASGVRPQLEPVREVHIDNSLVGPDPMVFGKSELIGHGTKSFVITAVAAGSTVEKWDAAANQWRDVSTPPTSSNPRQLLQLLQNRIIKKDDQVRWIPKSTDGVTQKAFEIIGWDDGSETSEPEGVNVPGAVENLEIDIVGDEVQVTWDPPTTGAAVTHYRIHQNPTTVVPSTQTSHTFAKVASPASYAVTVHANSAEGAGEAMTVSLSHASYVKNDGTVVDPILNTSGNVLDYDGPKLKADAKLVLAKLTNAGLTNADLNGADLTGADLTGADLTGAVLANGNLTGANLTGADLTGAILGSGNLTGANLTGVELYGANLTAADLTGADLTDANLLNANLTYAKLTNAKLDVADLTGADLNVANLAGADLSGANLSGADLRAVISGGITVTGTPPTLPADWQIIDGYLIGPHADLYGADLNSVDLSGANLTGAFLKGANLTNANLAGADLTIANLTGADLSAAILTNVKSVHITATGTPPTLPTDWQLSGTGYLIGPGADLTGADLRFENLTNSNLSGANLTSAKLNGSNLTNSNLSGANLTSAKLNGLDLTGANLDGANLKYANLTGADLSDANLTGADLTYVNLTGADLTGADLTNATLSKVKSGGITGNSDTKLPTNWQLTNGYLIGQLADLTNADLSGATLTNATLTGATLTDAILTNADLTSALVNDATLDGTLLTGATLKSTYFVNANLDGAILTDAHLNDANLHGATLTNANLENASLTSADLTKADLSGANLTSVSGGAKYNSATILPAGFDPVAAGWTLVS